MKSFSELTSASQVNNADLLAISQTSGSGYASKKTTVKDITDKSNLNLAEEYDSTSTYAVDDYVMYESVLYKCIGTTTGTFDSTKWTSVVVTDEMGSGGGGGTGGHTIIDENGNSMTARAGLQFFGAVEVTDDSANNRTLVEVLGGDFYNPVIYSTEEREIGVWTDGKPLYEKTWDFGSDLVCNSNSWTDTPITKGDIEKIVNIKAVNNAGTIWDMLGANTDQTYVQVYHNRGSNNAISIRYLTLQYTKSTDTAGSGSWTPQGVPTHHYSTDEQVVGTWNDKTLYEKTVYNTSSLNYGQINNISTGILDADEILLTTGSASYGNNNSYLPLPYGEASTNEVIKVGEFNKINGNVQIFVGNAYQSPYLINKIILTIRYTKSS